MHLLRVDSHSIDGAVEAIDLDQTPADIIALSFADADLSILAAAWEAQRENAPSLRLANLSALRHPFSIDLYLEKVVAGAKFVLIRLLGGKDYWSYGVDEISALARARNIDLAIVPGDVQRDARLEAASTLPCEALQRIAAYFNAGGVDNVSACLRFLAGHFSVQPPPPDPKPAPPFGLLESGCRSASPASPLALIVFYRAWLLAADVAPVEALAAAMAARGFRVRSAYVTSLKDVAAIGPLSERMAAERPDVILNLTAFSARVDDGATVLDLADAPVFQLVLSSAARRQWIESARGLSPADLAMNVVLPELDGRILAGAISFKEPAARHQALEFAPLAHRPEAAGVAFAADLAAAWTELRGAPRGLRRLACILSDYPAKAGRIGYAVGLDTPRSVVAIANRLAQEGFSVAPAEEAKLIAALTEEEPSAVLTLADYEQFLDELPAPFVASVRAAWGEPDADAAVGQGCFRFRSYRAGSLLVAVQPDRGELSSRKADYHSALLAPRHAYVAFYLWLRKIERVHAAIHCGTHGTLEWLPGKAVALSQACGPRAVLGPTPLIYPFIVNNPGEAAQAKRRAGAVTIGHLTPPLRRAGAHGAAAELEGLFDEYAEAQALDPRRARRLAELILARARATGLADDAGLSSAIAVDEALLRLDAWLCDLKDMRIGDGLHTFGCAPEIAARVEMARSMAGLGAGADMRLIEGLMADCGEAEMQNLVRALDGRFVPPGPGGAPARGRIDVLPTGRNLFSVDPRNVPTRTAWEIGRRVAEEVLARHVQDHGDWPRRIVLDVWGSAAMRTGGEDLAQALAFLGVRPRWDAASCRVSGFDVLPLASINRPRIDVTLRVSGLFRDVFPAQIALFDQAVRAVAALDEPLEDNPLAASARAEREAGVRRVFGAAPGQYGIGLAQTLNGSDWRDRAQLSEAYLAATAYAYGSAGEGAPAAAEFRQRVAAADAFVHMQDLADQDALSADAFAEHEGGFAAAAAALGAKPAIYHADASEPEKLRVRTMREEIARALRGRATNPLWLAGQMRHGFRGAQEIAETVDNFFAFAALGDFVRDLQFDLLFDATLGDETVRAFLVEANRAAAQGMAAKFEEALARGLWRDRRNSTAATLAGMRSAA